MAKIIILLVAVAVVIGGAALFMGKSSSPAAAPNDQANDGGVVGGNGTPVTIVPAKKPAVTANALYTKSGDVDCNYFWSDAQNSCSGIANTKWNSKSNWTIDAQAHGCNMTAIGGPNDSEVLTLSITDFNGVPAMQQGTSAVDLAYKTALDGSAFIGTPTSFSGLGTKAFKVLPGTDNAADALQIVAEKSTWIVNLMSLGSSLCHSENSAVNFVRAVANKLP